MKKIKNNITNIAVILLLVIIANPSYGEIYNTDLVNISNNLDITIKNIDINGTPINLTMTRQELESDPGGIYWKYVSADLGLQMQNVNIQTLVYDETEPVERHQLDIYYTDHPEQNKVILFVPGGAWRQGDKSLYETLGKTLAGYHDFTVVVINYRLSNEDGGNAVHPDHINDLAKAFAWVKNNISPYGDSSKIYLFGQSAGAHLVSLFATDSSYLQSVGYSPSDIKAAISMSGTYYLPDFVITPNSPIGLTVEETVMFKKIMQDAFGGWSDNELISPSPQVHINVAQPPFLVIYTYNDIAGFKESAENFVKAVKGISSESGTSPEISLRRIEFSDYTDDVWQKATEQAAKEPAMASYVGHWAEVMAINPNEPDGYITKLIVEFIQSH